MERLLLATLKQWSRNEKRKPLVLLGARQVGKTWLLRELGRTQYAKVLYLNFEQQPSLSAIFDTDLNPQRIVEQLSLFSGTAIEPGTTLIILDEIQACPLALTSLKYFHEDAPQYHLAAAGSLLGVSTLDETSYPVGKVDVFELHPLSYSEFLAASEPEGWAEYLSSVESPAAEIPMHEVLLDHYLTYLATGGMPGPVSTWLSTSDMSAVRAEQSDIVAMYERDYAKHAPKQIVSKLWELWDSVPSQLAKENMKFMYSAVRSGARAHQYQDAFTWLDRASVIRRLYAANTPGVPLGAMAISHAFKVYLNDVGLLGSRAGVPIESYLDMSTLHPTFRGAFVENYVLQSLLVQLPSAPVYWRSKNTAEVDFLAQIGTKVVPIEVKSGTAFASKSLSVYRAQHEPALAVRVSARKLGYKDGLLSIPFYLTDGLSRIAGHILD